MDRQTGVGVILTVAAMATLSCPLAAQVAAPTAQAVGAMKTEKPDLAEVHRKIASLAMLNETASYDERAVHWLGKRREQIMPQLIAALDDPNPTISQQCLLILKNAPASKQLTDALVAKASEAKSPLRYEALRQLERFSTDPRVVRLLDEASTQAEEFPELVVRARWAWLGGHPDRAVDILKPLRNKRQYETIEAIRLLGEIREPSAIAFLEPIAARAPWDCAKEAYKALAKIDPVKHGLSKDQRRVLDACWSGKASCRQYKQQMAAMAKLNAKEVRPLVMQMLGDQDQQGQSSAALLMLTAWNDKEALPQIGALMHDRHCRVQQEAVAAYLAIDDSREAEKEVLGWLPAAEGYGNEAMHRGIIEAAIPMDRKLTMLKAAQDNTATPLAVPHALQYAINQDYDVHALLVPLMDATCNLQTLGGYCEIAVADKEKRYPALVRRAMKVLASELAAPAENRQMNKDIERVAPTILGAVAVYDLKDLAAEVERLIGSKNAAIRAAAQAAGARLGVPGAMKALYAQLSDDRGSVCQQAARALSSMPLADEVDRAAREEAALACLGKPCEDFAMRVLTTCGRAKTIKALEAILDESDARRAVYAAWVLAQLPDKEAAAKGIRRVAIFGLFCRQIYQQGSGIDFGIAPDVIFHQVTERYDPKYYAIGEGPVRIPQELLSPFAWDAAEQQYAVRCYQLVDALNQQSCIRSDVHFLQSQWIGWRHSNGMDRTHLPLLREVALRDSHLKRLMVKGHAVAHFEYRQLAAKAIAAITKEKATYRGLTGETLDSDAFPEPYKDQDQLLATWFLDRVEKAHRSSTSESEWQSELIWTWQPTGPEFWPGVWRPHFRGHSSRG